MFALTGERSREVIVVDNASTDDTRAVLEGIACEAPVSVQVLSETRPGVGYALNTAVLVAQGAILVFTDDDCYAAPDLLERLSAVFTDPLMGYVGGRIILHDPADYPITVRDIPVPTNLPPRSVVKPGLIRGSIMAMRRDTILDIGGFDPNFGAGARFSGYDVDACGRASAAGWAGGYDPGPLVRHHHGRDEAAATRLLDRYRQGGGAYYTKMLIYSDLRTRVALRWARASAWHLLTQPRRLGAELRGAVAYLGCLRRDEILPMDERLAAGRSCDAEVT